MHFTCRSFIGKSSKGNWSQYWENEPDDSFLISQHGHLFGLINLSTDSDSDQASQLGRQIIAQINKSYFSSSTEENPLKKLQNSLDSVVTDHSLTSTTTIVTAVIFQQTLYLAVFHTGHCILQRSDQISPLLSGKSDQVTFISGPIRAEDKLFLCSDTFFQKITWSKIKTFLAVDSIQHIEEEILASLYSFDDQARLSAVIIQLHSDQPGDTEPLKEEALPEIPETSPSVVTPTPDSFYPLIPTSSPSTISSSPLPLSTDDPSSPSAVISPVLSPSPTTIPDYLTFTDNTDAFTVEHSSARTLYQDKNGSANRYTFYSPAGSIAVHVGPDWSWQHPGREFTPIFKIDGRDTFRYDINLQTIVDIQKDGNKYTIQCVHNAKEELKSNCDRFFSTFRFL